MSSRSVELLIRSITFPIKPSTRISIEHDIGAHTDDSFSGNPDSLTCILLASNIAANSEPVLFEFVSGNGGVSVYLTNLGCSGCPSLAQV